MSARAVDIIPSLTGENTDALVEEQGYTYNQPGMTYNQAGVMYGGVYNYGEDVIPAISLATSPVPSISGYADIYSPFVPDPDKGMLIGPGITAFGFLTYP